MGSVHAKTMNSNLSDGADDSRQSDVYLMIPSVVDNVHIEGLQRTKTEFILPELTKILKAQTFGEVVAFTLQARDDLNSLEIFKHIDVLIDTSQGRTSSPNGFDVTLIVKEKGFVTSNIGTQVGNNEGTMVFGARMNNIFGRGEGLKGDLGFGTNSKTSYQLGFSKPCCHGNSYYIGAHKSMTDVPQSSHKEASQGVNINYMFPSVLGQHSVGWEGTWRELTGIGTSASFSVRQQAGHSLKSSLLHSLVADTRDHPTFPTQGCLVKVTQELAGVGGDVRFIKNNVELQESIEILNDMVLSWSLQAGLMNTPPNTTSRINDRLFLGGPLSVRGFQMKGIGPKDEGDCLGGEAYWAAGVHLYTPLPFRPGQGSFGDHIKTHAFVNAGNLTSLDSSLPWRQRASPLLHNIRLSCGVGLVLILGIARVELNYCIPRSLQSCDGVNSGLQIGVGVNFL